MGKKFAQDALCTVGLAAGAKPGLDLLGTNLILLATKAFWLCEMVVVAAPADLQGFAAFGDAVGNWIGRLRLGDRVM